MADNNNMADPEPIIGLLWSAIEGAGFDRVRLEEGWHPAGHKVNVGYGSGTVRVRLLPVEPGNNTVIDINLYADADVRQRQINLVMDELAMVLVKGVS